MKAKEFLQRLLKIDRLIENKLYEQAYWKNKAIGTTTQLSGDKVQSSSNPEKMADAISEYLDLEKEITERIDSLIDKRKEIISVIEQLNALEYDVLHKIYVQYITLDAVAVMYGKTYSWVTTIHGRALKNLQKILDEREIEHNE